MPFIPLLIVWQVFGRSTSFVLGWATALFFGQIPGNKGRVVSITSVLALAWVLLAFGAGPVLAGGIVAERFGLVDLRAWDLDLDEVLVPILGLVGIPPLITAIGERSGFHEDPTLRRWLTNIPRSYPIALSLGTGLFLMILVTPVLLVRQRREGVRTLHIPLLVREGRFDELTKDLQAWLSELTGAKVSRESHTGLSSWPLRTLRYAAAELLRSVVREDPVKLRAGRVEVSVFATNLSLVAPAADVYRLRAGLHKRVALSQAFLTWSEEPQRFETELMRVHADDELELSETISELEALQEEIDDAHIKSDEWDVLYRLRLQVERDAYESAARDRPKKVRAS